jgi:hypothetical protein
MTYKESTSSRGYRIRYSKLVRKRKKAWAPGQMQKSPILQWGVWCFECFLPWNVMYMLCFRRYSLYKRWSGQPGSEPHLC